MFKVGDKVRAKPDTVTAIFAEGRTGEIASVRYSGDPWSQNLLKWGDELILMGFHPENVELVEGEDDD